MRKEEFKNSFLNMQPKSTGKRKLLKGVCLNDEWRG